MMRFSGFLLVLLLVTGCQRYTIGAANAAPRVVSGNAETAETGDHATAEAHSDETSDAAHAEDTGHSADTASTDAAHTEDAGHSEDMASSEDAAHGGASIPELDNALVVVQESFAHARGSKAARHEAAQGLETAREALHAVAETGAISHWEDLDHYFETAIEKVVEGTNDAPNALNRLLVKLEKAGKH
jgi:hypothetical protein